MSFDVYLNDRKLCRAGVDDGVLSAIVSWARLSGLALDEAKRLEKPTEEARLQVGGLRDDTHFSWSDRVLRVGDRVAILVTNATAFDRPARSRRRNQQEDERRERDYYLRLKQKFEPAAQRSSGQSSATERSTQFLNVDLELKSRRSLQPLVDAFGRNVTVLRIDRTGPSYCAHLELSITPRNPDVLIRRFVRLVQRLPRSARALWNGARAREFNIGIQAGGTPYSFGLLLEHETLREIAGVGGRVGITVYGAGDPG